MIQESFQIHPLVELARQCGNMGAEGIMSKFGDVPVPDERQKIMRAALAKSADALLKAKLTTSFWMAQDFIQLIDRGDAGTISSFGHHAQGVYKALQCECLQVLCERVDGRPIPSSQHSKSVLDRFPTAVSELDEAEWCLIFERWTASVFHAMRAAEVALKAVYKSLGVPSPNLRDSWGALMGPMDVEITPASGLVKGKPPTNPTWQTNLSYFAELVADFRAVKRAYRDTTMHVESVYTEQDARAILGGAMTLIRDCAVHLDQDGNFLP